MTALHACPFIVFLSAWPAAGDEVERILRFTQTTDSKDVNEIAVIVRRMGEYPHTSFAPDERTLRLRGASSEIAFADWLFNHLDQPRSGPATQEYGFPAADDIARIFYLPQDAAMWQLNELAAMVRTVSDLRMVFTYSPHRAILVRGTSDRTNLAEWMVKQITQPPPTPIQQYQMPGDAEGAVRIFFARHVPSAQALNELAALVRTTTDIRRLLTYSTPKAITLRDTAERIAHAEWLFRQLDQPPNPSAVPLSAAPEYHLRDDLDHEDTVRVFYLSPTKSPQTLTEVFQQLRAAMRLPRMLPYTPLRAIVLRSNSIRVGQVEQLLKEWHY